MTAAAATGVAVPAQARAEAVAPQSLAAGAQTHAWISAEAARLSGRAVVVGCAGSAREWAGKLSRAGLAGPAGEYYGFSLVRRGELQLSPYVCEGLRLGRSTSTRRSHELQVAWSVNVLVHESVHLARSSVEESVAEACARIALPRELHRLYRIEYRSAEMRRLTSAAAWFRASMPAAYHGGTCGAPGS